MSRRDLKHTAGQLSPPPGCNPRFCTFTASGSPVCACSESRVKSGLWCDLELAAPSPADVPFCRQSSDASVAAGRIG